MPNNPSKHWVFTINNHTADDVARLNGLALSSDAGPPVPSTSVSYIIFGNETGEAGTPHLQGYIAFHGRVRFTQVRAALGGQAHIERMRGTPKQAAAYCRKDGDFTERGDPPEPPSSSKFEDVKEYALAVYNEKSRPPNDRELALEFPHHFIRYGRAIREYVRLICPEPRLELGTPNGWQQRLFDELKEGPDDRKIKFVVDEVGGKGKTWFQRYMLTEKPDEVQVLSVGKRDDVAHAIDPSKQTFLFNVPRGGMEYFQYTIVEQIKDRMIFSPKYNSQTKILSQKAHVVVFCNELPDMDKMTEDRYEMFNIDA